MATEQDRMHNHCAFMRSRKKKYKDSTDKTKRKTIKRMTDRNPSHTHSKYQNTNTAISTIKYQPPLPKQMISAYKLGYYT